MAELEEPLEDIRKTAMSTDTQVTLFLESRWVCSDLSSEYQQLFWGIPHFNCVRELL